MDVSKINYNFIEIFSCYYSVICDVFGNPDNKSPREQNKIRKWVEKNYLNRAEYPDNIKKYISKDINNFDFFDFLKSCYIRVKNEGTKQQQLFEKESADLSKEIQYSLLNLLETGCSINDIRMCGNDIYLDYGECSSYQGSLIFKNVTGIHNQKIDYIYFDGIGTFAKDEYGYRLAGLAKNWENDESFPVVLHFTDVDIETKIFNATSSFFYLDPWEHLSDICTDIVRKQKDFYNYEYNDKEKKLLPLMKEINALQWPQIAQKNCVLEFPLLKEYVESFGYDKIRKMIEKLEINFSDFNKRISINRSLPIMLNTKKYEPLWRSIYNSIADSQAEYPSIAEYCCHKQILYKRREEIQQFMFEHGYSGEYPDFVKCGNMKKVHLAESYGLTYFVGMEKNVEHHIHCIEDYSDGHLTIQFICGTAILKKNNSVEDAFSCCFNANGKCFSNTIVCEDCDNIKQKVQIAVKKAELLKLTKEERRLCDNGNSPTILISGVLMGLFFGVFMTLGMMLFTILVTAISASPQEIPYILKEMPWLLLFIFASVGFGGAMSIVNYFAQRK